MPPIRPMVCILVSLEKWLDRIVDEDVEARHHDAEWMDECLEHETTQRKDIPLKASFPRCSHLSPRHPEVRTRRCNAPLDEPRRMNGHDAAAGPSPFEG